MNRTGPGPEPGDRLQTGTRGRAGTGRAPGSVLIAMAAWLLTLTGGGALYVSFSAQYAYILAVRRQDAASVIEALLLGLLTIVFTLLALGLSRAGRPVLRLVAGGPRAAGRPSPPARAGGRGRGGGGRGVALAVGRAGGVGLY